MLRRIAPDLVIDVGANRGQFTLDVVSALPSARVIAFEPLPSEAAVFRRIFASHPNVELRTHALGSKSERREMHIAKAADSSSLLDFTPRQEAINPGTGVVGAVDVDVLTLDQVLDDLFADRSLPRPSLLKADVQGYELEVLRGGERHLSALGWIYVEVSFVELYRGQPLAYEVVNYLSPRGFGLVDAVISSRLRGRSIQADFLFENGRAVDK